MSFKAGRFLAALIIVSLLIHMHIAANGYAARKTKIAFTSTRGGNPDVYVMDADGRNRRRVDNARRRMTAIQLGPPTGGRLPLYPIETGATFRSG